MLVLIHNSHVVTPLHAELMFAGMQYSLLNASVHDQWLQQGREGHTMDDESRLACEVLRSKKAGKVPSHDWSPGSYDYA